MSQDPFGQENPYQSPFGPVAAEVVADPAAVHPEILKGFRQQIHALGPAWVFLGVVASVGTVLLFQSSLSGEVWWAASFTFLALGGWWIVFGVMAILKKMAAVRLGLLVSYLGVVVSLLSFNLCGIVILAVIILQAHRVIGWSKQMRDAGIPLTAKPGR